ncbi:hypothetical protein Hte_003294 [Hypoxylon texense]
MTRNKRLGKSLKYAQRDDVALPAPTHVALRFWLKTRNDISQVKIENYDLIDLSSFEIPQTIPQFLSFQIEAQKMADENRIPTQIYAAVVLIIETLSKKPTRGWTSPTLFRFYNKNRHRTYFVFAYLDYYMDSRTYSVDELLELRHLQSSGAINNLKSDYDIANIIKGQDSMSPVPPAPMKLANGDASSSTESDEVLFQGKLKSQTQWQLRPRTEAGSAKDKPLEAPTGIAAQKSEGFKRFYKAVVSPTHVRVTAGGRIVPNTRGSPSPTAKWDKEHSSAGGQEPLGASKESKLEPSAPMNGQAPYQPPMVPQFPGHPPVFHHMGLPMPLLYPIHPGLPIVYGMTPLPLVHPSGKHTTSAPRQKSAEEAPKAVKTQDGAGDKKPRPAPIKIAPPDQFDPNRPFYYEGDVIYPTPYAAGQPMTLPSPYCHFGTHIGSISQPSPLGPGFSPGFASPSFAGPNSARSVPASWPQPPLSAPIPTMGPHMTSIRISEVTKRQLEGMRTNLKYLEDQLHFNRHQIDEKAMEDQVQKFRQSIELFEQTYKNQLLIEAGYFSQTPPSSGNLAQRGVRLQTPLGRPGMRNRRGLNVSQASSTGAIYNGYGPNSMQSPWNSMERRRQGPKKKNYKGIGINSTTGILAPFAPLDPALEAFIDASKDRKLDLHTNTLSNAAGAESQPEGATSGTCDFVEPQLYGVGPTGQLDTGRSGSTVHDRPTPASSSQSRQSQPYLVGKLPQGMSLYEARSADYIYERQLTDEEKLARQNYWGKVLTSGLGLPKFDGQNFYPPSPVKKSNCHHNSDSLQVNYNGIIADNDPFSSSRTPQSTRPQKGSKKFSKAIPIVDPKDGSMLITSHKAPQSKDMADDTCKVPKDTETSSQALPSEDLKSGKKGAPSRRAVERSSNKSGHDLWQTMLKKGPASSTVLPSAVSSTTATGYLPPYQGNAAASLGPSVSNTNSSGARSSTQVGDKRLEHDSSQLAAEKVGENCPPSEARSADYDPLKDIQERMIRDAQRRGVVGSDWK